MPQKKDLMALKEVEKRLEQLNKDSKSNFSIIPDEMMDIQNPNLISGRGFGVERWSQIFLPRQILALCTYVGLVRKVEQRLKNEVDPNLAIATITCLSLVVDRVADRSSSLCRYDPSPTMSGINNTFARQALPMVWDFGEGYPIGTRSGGWDQSLGWLLSVLDHEGKTFDKSGIAEKGSATLHPLPDSMANFFFTDPPYYDAIAYADLSDFFYIWLKRSLGELYQSLFHSELTTKDGECIVNKSSGKSREYFEQTTQKAMEEGRRILLQNGLGVVVFAHKSTSGWESQLNAMIKAGWIITASWPIDTEMANKVSAIGQARLMSSIHLVCRPRENADGSVTSDIGDWRAVLQELPKRIHEWMPQLAEEGVVGADAIFACLGPALEVFSRYSSVEKPNGEKVTLREYLEKVWSAVSQEALSMVFRDADTQSFEEDARVTAMWLWTLGAGNGDSGIESDDDSDDDEEIPSTKKLTGYTLEYDAARKISQGLGARLEDLQSLVEVKGDKARLLPVEERAQYLFGNEGLKKKAIKKKSSKQTQLFEELNEEDSGYQHPELKVEEAGKTVLDRLHQAMLLFGTSRTDALKRFLVEDGIGKDERFWKLAQAMTALYPQDTDERRWVEAVQTYKKGLGF
ncbi:MAG TPA: hypothetical protein PLU50_01225 [Pseudobdellovibrionaceae bacterium]|nr:hypothetical protein [Pseudobdellovibrionaceae bacterium]